MSAFNMNLGANIGVLRLVIQIKTLIKAGIVFFILTAVFTFFGVRATEKPEFCSSCHIMKPYYEAWKTSTHNHVPCIECHYAPGIVNTFEGKFKAISQVAKYITATAGTRPWAEIPDESCLREGCHERRLLQGEVEFGPTVFDHRPHLLQLRRGKQLRCTSCHSQIVMGNHLNVTTSTCFTCHFKDKSFSELWDSCRKCHPEPKKTIQIDGKEFKHSEFIDRNVPCMKCHIEVVQGEGNVPRERCYSCHSEEQHTAKYDDHVLIHRKHVTEHKVECFDCHLEIGHAIKEPDVNALPSCDTCHIGTHKAQSEMYRGAGGRHIEPYRSEMAARQVDCRACHVVNLNDPDAEFKGTTLMTRNVACMACHGVEYKDILDNWNRAMKMMLEETGKLAAKANRAKAGWRLDKDDRLIAEGLLKDAVYNYKFVRNAGGVHNIHYSRELLNKSNELFKALVSPEKEYLRNLVDREEKTDHLPPDINCTKLCHVVAPDKDIVFFDRTFPHARHGPHMGVACTTCHSTERHGETLLTIESCNQCHHSEVAAGGCKTCHKGNVPTRLGKNFPHRNHFEVFRVACVSCHKFSKSSGQMSLAKDCAACHHGDKKARCENCHADQAAKVGGSAMDYDCTLCHRPPEIGFVDASNICVKCHALQVEEDKGKHADKGCMLCHFNHTWKFRGQGICVDCHKKYKHSEDVGNNCAQCHEPHAWTNKDVLPKKGDDTQ